MINFKWSDTEWVQIVLRRFLYNYVFILFNLYNVVFVFILYF